MNIDINFLILVFFILLYAVFFLIARLMVNRFSSLDAVFRKNNRKLATILSLLRRDFQGSFESIWEVKELWQNMALQKKATFPHTKEVRSFEETEIRALKSISRVRRKEAGTYLGIIGSENARKALEEALACEKDPSVKIYLSNALTEIRHIDSLPAMTSALLGSHRWYREKAISNILEYGSLNHPLFLEKQDTRQIEWFELNVKYACSNFNEDTRRFLFDFVDRFDGIRGQIRANLEETRESRKGGYQVSFLDKDMDELLTLACRTLSDYFYADFSGTRYREHKNPIVKNNAFWAVSKKNSSENFLFLLASLEDARFTNTLIATLSRMIQTNPRFLYLLEEAFARQEDKAIRSRMARVISNRIEYYVMQLLTRKSRNAEEIIAQVLENQEVNELIGFLNLNRNLDI